MKLLVLFLTSFTIFSYGQTEVSIETGNGKLSGTLLADTNHKENPIVYFIGGSGPSTRNGTGDSQLRVTEALFENGIYSLSVDKRGAGKSADALTEETSIRIDTFVNDAIRWIKFLESEGYSNIIVAGHSQGSLVGMMACQKTNAKKFISLAGAGRTIDLILKEQLSSMLPVYRDSAYSVLDSLKKGVLLDNISPYLYSLFRPSVQPFISGWIQIDPTEEIKKLTIPVMIIQGTTDLQVKQEDAVLLHEANSESRLIMIKGMNHVFRDAPEDRKKNIATYTDTDLPVSKTLIKQLVKFIKS